MHKIRKAKVLWTDEEIHLATSEAVKLSLKDSDSIWPFFAEAQKVLPPDRQRWINGKNNISKELVERFCQLRQEILEQGVPFEVQIEGPPTIKELQVERPRQEILDTITNAELMELNARRLATFAGNIALFMDVFSKMMVKADVKPLPVAIQEQPPQQIKPTVAEQVVAPTRKRRVLLYGFLPGQEKEIRERSKDFNLELMFREHKRQCHNLPYTCSWCLVMNKLNHPSWDKLNKKYGSNRIKLIEGVTAALKELANINSQIGMGIQ